MVQIEEDINVKVNIPGSEVLGTDLNPDLNTSTNVSDLNGGTGITAGSFSITDRAGAWYGNYYVIDDTSKCDYSYR